MIGATFGWIGSICFAACGIPQAFRCLKQGHAIGLSPWCLALWALGEVFYVGAVLMEFGWIWWMLINYLTNIVCLFIICRYRIWPRRNT